MLLLFNKGWEHAHTALGSVACCQGRKGAANTFRFLRVSRDVHLIGVFDGLYSTLAHEFAHIAFDICQDAGVRVVPGETNETFCYLLDALFAFGEKHMKAGTESRP
jgi:hypothetical protein